MRFVAALFFWLVTTVALAVAVPAVWAQRTSSTKTAMPRWPRRRPRIRGCSRRWRGADHADDDADADNGYELNTDLVRGVAAAYTGEHGFPGQFGQANRMAHRWMFTDSVARAGSTDGQWLIDLAPMLSDSSFRQTLGNFDVDVPHTLTVPITVSSTARTATGPAEAVGDVGAVGQRRRGVLTGMFALLTIAAAPLTG